MRVFHNTEGALRAFWGLEKTVLHEFVLVGLYCGPLLTLIPPRTQAKKRGSGNRVSDFRVSGGPPV